MSRVQYSKFFDKKYQKITHKIYLQGTSKFLLLNTEEIADLINQIAATEGINNEHSNR